MPGRDTGANADTGPFADLPADADRLPHSHVLPHGHAVAGAAGTNTDLPTIAVANSNSYSTANTSNQHLAAIH